VVQGDKKITLDHPKIGFNSQKIDGCFPIKRNSVQCVATAFSAISTNKPRNGV
jgi:hypothetical protein